jgi:predicted Zn finger-like uncharacterized protein
VKFLCDRCKTRYSIGDDRVRGKILKIRCKNCANVITVREGMSPEDDSVPGDAAERARKAASAATEVLEPAAAATGPSRPANEPAAPAGGPSRAVNEPAASRGGVRDPLAGVTGKRSTDVDTVRGLGRSNARSAATAPRSEGPAARAAAVARPAPAALEEEWYVSVDGEQAGPFSLAAAQRWVTQQPLDAELHCWSEGFDDWLPVDKVSHFRGLRKRPSAQSAPPPPLPRATAGAPRPAPAEDEPKPLFVATMASLERSAPAMSADLGLPPPAASPAREAPIAARGDLGIRPSNGAPGPATTPLGRRPEAAAESKPDARPGVRPQAQRAPAAQVKPAGKTAGAEREAPAPAAPERPPADPFDLAEGYAGDGKTVLEAMPFDDAPVEPGRAAGSPGAPEGTAPAVPARAAPPRSDFGDDDLDIGEVSRVVNLADVAQGSRGAQRSSTARRGTGAEPAAGSTGVEPGLRSSTRSTASAASLAPGGEPGVASAPIVRAQRRGLIALLAVAMALVLGVIGAVVLVTGSDDAPNTSLDTVQDIDTSRPEDPIAHHPVGSAGSASVAIPAPSPPIAPRPHPRTAPGPGTGQIAEAPPAGNPLGGDEIEDVARKHQDMTQRCYMRSQRGADTILVGDVKKIAVTLTIDREGNVSDLQLSDHAADTLGKCLAGAIRTWKFRPSAGGTFRFSLNFVSG